MDNMLYIIVGLVVVLLVAVLIMRKNKAQRPVATNNNSANAQARISPTLDRATLDRTPIDGASTHATKFDSITIAQRFMDQERYDKAIETLERGLTKKPYDSALLLKLLDIYVTTKQNDDFYRTYNTIQTHSDPHTIEQAAQLKNSLGGSHSEVADSAASMNLDTLETNATVTTEPLTPAIPSTSTPAQDEFSLDFDTSYATDKNPNPAISTDTANDERDDNNFDLTLDDLEALDLETIDNNFVKNTEAGNSNQLIDNVDNIDDDFNFAFEESVENEVESLTTQPNDSTVIAKPLVEISSDARTDELSTDELSFDDDFVLDLADDLQTDNSQISSSEALPTAQSDMQDFVFSLDDDTADSFIATDDAFDIENPHQSDTSDNTTTLNEDIGFELDDSANNDLSNNISNIDTSRLIAKSTFDNNTFNNNISAPTIAQSHSIALESSHLSSNNPTINADLGALSIDSPSDDWLIDDNFMANFDDSIDSDPLVAVPVIELSSTLANEQSPVDFNLQFSADFDFVKSLDSQQVTLDLADQYLQLGEYDSARRLLAEVVEQGSSEQKQKAQALLARTT